MMMKKKLIIEGMSCGHCANHVKSALADVSGVKTVEVDVANKNAVIEVEDEVEDAKLKYAVEEEAGYTLVSIE